MLFHMINQGKNKRLLFAAQSCPTLQQFLLGFCQQNRFTTVGKKLGKCNVKCSTDFFQRRYGWHYIFTVPGGYRSLGHAGTFCKLVFCLASLFPVCCYSRKHSFHHIRLFACVLRKLYFDKSLYFNHLYRIIYAINTTI